MAHGEKVERCTACFNKHGRVILETFTLRIILICESSAEAKRVKEKINIIIVSAIFGA